MELRTTIPEGPIKKIFFWRDVKITAPLFVAINLFFIATLFYKKTLLYVVSISSVWYLVLGFLFVNVCKLGVGFLGPDFVAKPTLGEEYVTKALVEKHIDTFVEKGNWFIDQVKLAVYCTDNTKTLRFVGIFFGLTLVGRIFSDMVLLYCLALVAFLAPPVYEHNQKAIDDGIGQAKVMANEQYVKAKDAASAQAANVKTQISERATPLLEKNAAARQMAEKLGVTPLKKAE